VCLRMLPGLCEGSAENTTTTTTALPQCTSPLGLQEFYIPAATGAAEPYHLLPGMILSDLDLRARYDPEVRRYFGSDFMNKVPGGFDPCLRLHQKSVIEYYNNPKYLFGNMTPWVLNSADDPIQTHTVWLGYEALAMRAAVPLDALNIVTVSRERDIETDNEEIFTYFLRQGEYRPLMVQPLWGFYTIWQWKSLLLVYPIEKAGLAYLEMLSDMLFNANVPFQFFYTVGLRYTHPFMHETVNQQMKEVIKLPVRLLFLVGSYGVEHEQIREDHLDFRTLTVDVMVSCGVWMPTFQVIQDENGVWNSKFLTNNTFMAKFGKPGYGTYMYTSSRALTPADFAIWLPAYIARFAYSGHLNQVNLSSPEIQDRYGVTYYDKGTRDKLMRTHAIAGGLEGLFWFSGTDDMNSELWNIIHTDFMNREMLASACYWKNGGVAKFRDAPLRFHCNLVSTLYGTPGTNMIWPYDYTETGNRVENSCLYGYQWADPDDVSTRSNWNPIVLCDGPKRDSGCYLGGNNIGFPSPIWSDGSVNETPPTQYRNCTPGMFQTPIGHCDWCPAGRYTITVDAAACIRCQPGYYSLAQATSCIGCSIGKFSPESGSETCLLCNPGSFTAEDGKTQCALCAQGSFSQTRGKTACISCKSPLTTQFPGEADASKCVCPLNTYKESNGSCKSCMEGLACEANWPNNWAANGDAAILQKDYFSWKDDQFSTFLCSNNTGSCPGGPSEFCDGGRTGFLCTECQKDNHHIEDGVCEKCPVFYSMFLGIIIVLMIVGILGLYYLANGSLFVNVDHPQGFFVFLGLVITVLQVFGIVKKLSVPWPQGQYDFMHGSSLVFALDANSIPMACVVGSNVISQYAVQSSAAFVMVFLVMALMFIMNSLCRAFQNEKLMWKRGKAMNAAGQLSQALFIAFCIAMVRPLRCYDHPNGDQSVMTFPSVLCWDGLEHTAMMIVSAIVLFFYILPFIAWCVYGCLRAPARSSEGNHEFLQTFRFLLYRFRPDLWWWGIVFLLRQTILAFAIVVPASNPHAQVFYTSSVITIYVFVVCIFWPWITTEMSLLDAGTCCLLILFLLCATQFLPAAPEAQGKVKYLLAVMLLVGLLCGRYVVILVLGAAKHGVFSEFGGDKPDRLVLCAQWIAFLHSCEKQQSKTIINAVCKMNAFDRKRLQSVMVSWLAYAEVVMDDVPIATSRLTQIPSRTKVGEAMLADGQSRVSHIKPDSDIAFRASEITTTDATELINHEHIKDLPRILRISASSGTPKFS